jgi:hypothetical protein
LEELVSRVPTVQLVAHRSAVCSCGPASEHEGKAGLSPSELELIDVCELVLPQTSGSSDLRRCEKNKAR